MWFDTHLPDRSAVVRMDWGSTAPAAPFNVSLIAEIAAIAELAPGDPVYEIAAGTGRLTASLLRFGFTVTAAEPRAELRQELSELASPRLEIRPLAFQRDEITPGGYAAVFATDCLGSTRPATVLARVNRAVGRGGALCLLSTFSFLEPRVQAKLNRCAFSAHRVLISDPTAAETVARSVAADRRIIADSGLFDPAWWDSQTVTRTLSAEAYAELAADHASTPAWTEADRWLLEEQVLGDLDDLALDTVTITDHLYALVTRTRSS